MEIKKNQDRLEELETENFVLQNELAKVKNLLEIRQAELEFIQTSIAWRLALWLRQKLENIPPIRRIFHFIKAWVLKKDKLGSQHVHPSNTIDKEKHNALKKLYQSLTLRPIISLIMTVPRETESDRLLQSLNSIRNQIYANWELIILSDTMPESPVNGVIDNVSGQDNRIRVISAGPHRATGNAYNKAMGQISGDWVGFMHASDLLVPQALLRFAESHNMFDSTKLIYCDEAFIDNETSDVRPYHKSAWNPDRLLSQNYIGCFFAVKTVLILDVGGIPEKYDHAQFYALLLRLTADLDEQEIVHIPEILYLNRMGGKRSKKFTSPDSSIFSVNALKDALRKRNTAWQVSHSKFKGIFKVSPSLARYPKVTVIIPTKDRVELLTKCVQGVLENTDYDNLEIIIVTNNSTETPTLNYLKKISLEINVQVIAYPHEFNYAAINNFAVSLSSGEVLLFLNNDITIISQGWLKEMVGHAVRKEIGSVGAKLLYPGGRIQHAGVVMGLGGVAGHSHRYMHDNDGGYFNTLACTQNVYAVTGACLAIKKSLFREVGGFDESFKVAYNDVDLCLKVHAAGYRNLFTPWAELMHYEKASRGENDTPSKEDLFQRERSLMFNKWGHVLLNDPYYNPNLTIVSEDFSLANKARDCSPRIVTRMKRSDGY